MIVPSFPQSARAWCLALASLASWAVRLALPPFAVASETVRLYASFSPDRPGASTTITFGFTIGGSNGQVPLPLTSVNLHLPAGIGLARMASARRSANPANFTRKDTVPRVCPVGGYPFAADLAFEDGSHITARTTAPCPPHARRRAGSAHPTAPHG